MEELTLEGITKTLESIISEEDLQPYKDLGNGLYELPGNIITNEKGLKEYLDELRKEIQGCNVGGAKCNTTRTKSSASANGTSNRLQ